MYFSKGVPLDILGYTWNFFGISCSKGGINTHLTDVKHVKSLMCLIVGIVVSVGFFEETRVGFFVPMIENLINNLS